ncbi:MAG TPA: hypothetical protein VFK40_01525 [Nitrososphaeraceae archaeon]|nr:hypothetical protein [Nitrososphaeraceae archaeon]
MGFLVVTWSLLQISFQTFFENNENRLIKIPLIYAQEEDAVNDNGGVFDDNGDRDVEEIGLDNQNIPDEDFGQEDDPVQLNLSGYGYSEIQPLIQLDANDDIKELTLEDNQYEYVYVSIFSGGVPSGTNINSQLLPVHPLSLLFIGLPFPPAGPFPPGSLPPIPGSPLPPGSPIPPGGGPTPSEDLPPSPQLREQFPEKQELSPQLREKLQQSFNIEFKSYKNKNLGASFDIPVNWIQQQTPSRNEEIVFTEPHGKATLTIKVINASGLTIFEAASDFISGLKEGSSQTHNVYLNNIDIQNFASNNQESSKVISYTFGKDPTFPLLQGVTYITLNNNKVYLANFVTDVQNFESYNLIMQRILSSFEILSDVSINSN